MEPAPHVIKVPQVIVHEADAPDVLTDWGAASARAHETGLHSNQAAPMTRANEKSRRMDFRRTNGTRAFGHPLKGLSTKTRAYLVAHACFDCRSTFKKPPAAAANQAGHKCPRCKSALHEMGRSFRAPAKNDLDGWKKIQALYAHGFWFFSYRSFENCPRLPERFRDVEPFVRGLPQSSIQSRELNDVSRSSC